MADQIDIDSDDLKDGLLGLVIALVEIIRDALKLQAMRRMDNGRLTEDQMDKLGSALIKLDEAIKDIKDDQGIANAVDSTRDGLNEVVDEALNPENWTSEGGG